MLPSPWTRPRNSCRSVKGLISRVNMSKLHDLLDTTPIILADGAMGTMLFAAGLESGDSPELWNVNYPERVQAVHRGYVEVGTQLILTNSFGRARLPLWPPQLSTALPPS